MKSRRSLRILEYDYSEPGAYFVTICTMQRENLFGEITGGEILPNEFGIVTKQCWDDLLNHYQNIELDEFIVMPNHVHGIIFITDDSPVGAIHELPLRIQRRKMLLPKIIGRFKMTSAKRINELRGTGETHVWQRNYFEHIIRNEKSLNRIREYITGNPLQWHLDKENLNGSGKDEFNGWLRSFNTSSIDR